MFESKYQIHTMSSQCSSLTDGLSKVQNFIDKLVNQDLVVSDMKMDFDGSEMGFSKINLKVWTVKGV